MFFLSIIYTSRVFSDCPILALHKGKVNRLRQKNQKNENQNKEFWTSFLSLVEGILNIWHDEIIKAQKDNDAKLKKIKEEGYDEFLFAYYYFNNDTKFFMYLKRLATRYPNSRYAKSVYGSGHRKKKNKYKIRTKLKNF